MYIYMYIHIYIYIYMKPARGPQTMFFLSMIVVESLSCKLECYQYPDHQGPRAVPRGTPVTRG